MLHFYKDG
jgi:hypothetical protein